LNTAELKNIVLAISDEAERRGCRRKIFMKAIGISERTVLNWKKNGTKDQRKGAVKIIKNGLSAAEINAILDTACDRRFADLTPHEIVPILAEEGVYLASVSSFYRILKKHALVKSKPLGIRREPVEIKADRADVLWSWDISYLQTNVKGKYYYLYLFTDIWSRRIVGWNIYEQESAELAKELFCRIAGSLNVKGVTLHSDNGGPMISSSFRLTLERLGVTASFSRPNTSNDNAFSESLFKTIKYSAGYPKCFKRIEDACDWMERFVRWYNYEHRHSGIGYVTPMQRLNGDDVEIFLNRNRTFEEARKRNPERWSGNSKVWQDNHIVFLKKGNYAGRKAS